MDAELEITGLRVVVARHQPAHVLGDGLVAPFGEELLRREELAVALLDARALGRADGCGGHAIPCLHVFVASRESLAAAARSAGRAACDRPHGPRRADSAQGSRDRSR